MNRKSILLATSFAVASLAAAQSARADEPGFGEKGVMISADRLLPIISWQSSKTDDATGGSTTDSKVSFAFGSNGGVTPSTFYSLPRLGFDVVVIPHLTVGGSIWIYTDLSSNENVAPGNGGASQSSNQPKVTYWGFQPRIGYIFPLAGSVLSLWPRAGIAYNNASTGSVTNQGNTTSGGTIWQLGLDLEAMFVITPWNRHFGITIGPTGDIPIAGKTSSTSTQVTNGVTTTTTVSENTTMWQVGLQAGVVGHF